MTAEQHTDHRRMTASGWHGEEAEYAWLICLDCQTIVQPLAFCGRRTKRGEPCRVVVRDDLGHTMCKAHSA